MNLAPRQHLGRLRLSPALLQAVQLEWSLVEQPALPRFRNFPLVDTDEPAPLPATGPASARRSAKFSATPA